LAACLKRKYTRNYFAFWQEKRLNNGIDLARRRETGLKMKIKSTVLKSLALTQAMRTLQRNIKDN
jgi:hypothetical protein